MKTRKRQRMHIGNRTIERTTDFWPEDKGPIAITRYTKGLHKAQYKLTNEEFVGFMEDARDIVKS